jgi:hypothetical protein
MAVDADLRNAGLWLTRDGNQSNVFTPTATCGIFAAPISTGSTRYITYTWSANTLNRQDSNNPGQTLGVARHVTGIQCPTSVVTGTMAVTIISTGGQVSNSATFTVTMRVD